MSLSNNKIIAIISLVLGVLTVLALVVYFSAKFSSQIERETAYTLLSDVCVFINSNNRMPKNWSEFTEWKGDDTWKVEQLEELFELPWGSDLKDLYKKVDILVTVKASNLKTEGSSYNEYMRDRILWEKDRE